MKKLVFMALLINMLSFQLHAETCVTYENGVTMCW